MSEHGNVAIVKVPNTPQTFHGSNTLVKWLKSVYVVNQGFRDAA